jgi:hypothetical protein
VPAVPVLRLRKAEPRQARWPRSTLRPVRTSAFYEAIPGASAGRIEAVNSAGFHSRVAVNEAVPVNRSERGRRGPREGRLVGFQRGGAPFLLGFTLATISSLCSAIRLIPDSLEVRFEASPRLGLYSIVVPLGRRSPRPPSYVGCKSPGVGNNVRGSVRPTPRGRARFAHFCGCDSEAKS